MTRRGWILFGILGFLWGIPYLMIKVAVAEVSVPVLVFARAAIGAAILLPLAWRGDQLSSLRRHWKPLTAFAALEIILPWWFVSDGEIHLTSSMTGLLIAAIPIIAVVSVRLSGDTERLGGKRWAGLGLGLAGVAVLAGPELGGGAWPTIEVLLAAVCYATAPLVLTRWLKDVPALPITAACLVLAALVYLPPAILTWPDAMPSAGALAAIATLAIACTALALLALFALIREVGTSRAVVFTYINPAVAVAAGAVVLSEPLNATILVSFGLILAGSVLATAATKTTKSGDHHGVPEERLELV